MPDMCNVGALRRADPRFGAPLCHALRVSS
jgi:hypothetical protein